MSNKKITASAKLRSIAANNIFVKKNITKTNNMSKSKIGKNISLVVLKILMPNQTNKTGKYSGNRYKIIAAKSVKQLYSKLALNIAKGSATAKMTTKIILIYFTIITPKQKMRYRYDSTSFKIFQSDIT